MIWEFLSGTWPWFVAGPAIALVLMLLLLQGRAFGLSSSLETICTMAGAGSMVDYFKSEWKDGAWLLIFVLGSILGGVICHYLLPNEHGMQLSDETINTLNGMGIGLENQLIPTKIFSWDHLFSLQGFLMLIVGGFFVGFGTRYAGGCTSGHAISGLANLQLPSLVATLGFFLGGLMSTYFLLPMLFS